MKAWTALPKQNLFSEKKLYCGVRLDMDKITKVHGHQIGEIGQFQMIPNLEPRFPMIWVNLSYNQRKRNNSTWYPCEITSWRFTNTAYRRVRFQREAVLIFELQSSSSTLEIDKYVSCRVCGEVQTVRLESMWRWLFVARGNTTYTDLTICFSSFAVNLVAIVILSRGRCGLSKCITRYLVAMAAADFIVVVIAIIAEQINNIYMFANFLLITPVCSLTLVFKIASIDCSVWFTVAFTFDRYIAICSQRIREKYCTQRTATVVIVTVGALACIRCIPVYFVVEPLVIIDNIPWRCVQIPEFFTSLMWQIYEYFDSILTPLLPICLILLFNCLTVRSIISANRVRQALRGNSESQNDSELKNRKKSMILLFALSTNFVLLSMPYVIHSMIWQPVNYFYTDKYVSTPTYIMQQCGFILQALCTCSNTCIYGLTQRKFRQELKNGVKYLFTLNGHLCK